MPVGPVSSRYDASDYYMNYYRRRPQVQVFGTGRALACCPHPHKEDARAPERLIHVDLCWPHSRAYFFCSHG